MWGKKTFPPTAGRHDAGRTVQDAAGAQRPPRFRTGGRGIPASRGATDRRSPPASAGLVPVQTMMRTVAGTRPARLVIKARDRGPEKREIEVLFPGHGHRTRYLRRRGPGGDRRQAARRRRRPRPRARRPRNGGTTPRPVGGRFGCGGRTGSAPIGRGGRGIPAGRRVTGRRGLTASASAAGRRPAGLARDGLKPARRGDRRRAGRARGARCRRRPGGPAGRNWSDAVWPILGMVHSASRASGRDGPGRSARRRRRRGPRQGRE